MNQHADEETPLLQTKGKRTPLPWFQFFIVLFLQLSEPLTSQVIYPFAPQLIRDIGITHGDETKVGYYVGFVESIFFLTQAFTVLYWSKMSDRFGRKPIILVGLCGISLSMYCFGLSETFFGLVLSRSLCGALNGNIGVIKSMMVEMTDSTNISQAYSYFPIAWSTGTTIGPMIGGSLSHPAERFPKLFGASEFLKRHPYFLPCAVPATYAAAAWLVTFLFLKETVARPVPLSRLVPYLKNKNVIAHADIDGVEGEKPIPLRLLMTRPVLLAAANYAFLSLVDISYRATQPLFLSTPIGLGGLGLPPQTIGNIMSAFGILNGIFQVFFFAKIHDRWGSKRVFIAGVASSIPLFVLFPIMSAIAKVQGITVMVWALVGTQTVLSVLVSLSYGAIFIYISGASPSRSALGATNGIAQTTVSIMRTLGPATANSLFSLSIEKNYLGGTFVYLVLIAMSTTTIFVGSMLPRQVWRNPN